MPIVVAPLNKQLKVVKILTDDSARAYLASLGIMVSSLLTVLSVDEKSVICAVGEGRIALDKDVATKILVA